ncbi:MAG: HAD-IA family hydrolase [Thermoanaerobaculia bacterium]|nr:MAG: HAD-IA family hydrolase [Thermoanaerobaculia bacterium]
MTAPALRAIVFDLDGTLIDSRHDLAEAVNRTRRDLGLPGLELAQVMGMVGRGARELVRRALGGDPGEALLERALAAFLAHYEPICTERTRPYPGVPELLAEEAGKRPLALLTNKPERATRRILEHFGWTSHFRHVIGGDTPGARKPSPDGLLEIARRLDLAPRELILVGDSPIDLETAAAAGASFVLVEWGFPSAAERAAISGVPRAADVATLRRRLAG